MAWTPNDYDGGWDFDAGSMKLAVRPMDGSGASARVSWHVKWVGGEDDERGYDCYADNFENAARQAINFALRQMKADRKKLLAARMP